MDDSRTSDYIFGRNPVIEALKSGRSIDRILVASGDRNGSIKTIIALAKEKGIPVKDVSSERLDLVCGKTNHQSVAAVTAVSEYSTVEDILKYAEEKNEKPFIVIADEIEDPHNLGAIIRTAEAAGAHGVIIPKRRSAGLTYTVGKASAGAVEYIRVARVPNISACVDSLKQYGVWVFGADMDGEDYSKLDYRDSSAIIIGNEGSGLGRLVRQKCDFTVSIPMSGKINSLNASVAAGIIIYEAVKQRKKG